MQNASSSYNSKSQQKSSQQADTPWAVQCPHHGQVFLSHEDYASQMSNPNDGWRCFCGRPAEWDEDNYQRYLDALETEAA